MIIKQCDRCGKEIERISAILKFRVPKPLVYQLNLPNSVELCDECKESFDKFMEQKNIKKCLKHK